MPPLELAAALLGLVNITLLARRSVWNFPFGLAMVSLYALVYLEARLFSAVALQGFFFLSQLWGWQQWRRISTDAQVPVRALTARARLAAALATAALATALGLLTSSTGAAVPFLDAGNTSLSVAAQLLTMARYLEGWPLWVAVNILSLALYSSQGLWITTGLYVIFLALSIWSWLAWRRAA